MTATFNLARAIKWTGIVGACVWNGPASARDDAQLWPGVAVTVKLGDNWRLSEEVVARFSDRRDGLYEVESNTLLGYRIGSKVTLWAGYTHDPTYNAGQFAAMEHRAREQLTFDNLISLRRARISARLRLEQRWRPAVQGTAWRFRPFVRFSLPLRPEGHTALVLSHESFIDLNKTAFQRVAGEERMRNFAGLNFAISKKLSLEAGYMMQHGFVPAGHDSNDHAASATLSLSL